MKNLICSIVLVMTGLLLNIEPAYAAFPTQDELAVSVETEKRSFEEFINVTIEKYHLPAPPIGDGGVEGNSALSIASLALGVAGFAAIVISLSFFPLWGLVLAGGAALGIAAIILGAMGSRRRPLRGIGIAGFVMGIIDVSILLVVGFFALLLAVFLGGF
ncbi:MAG: hypothetical protein K0R82_1444 [Flavipsychrobacter sp.]|jgi:hypothetical protein|nr:hypothetical protein [Flavipsychrobacter sp.]